MELKNKKMDMDAFLKERDEVMLTWPTGKEVDFEDGVRYQLALPDSKRFSVALAKAERDGKTLCQPRAGVVRRRAPDAETELRHRGAVVEVDRRLRWGGHGRS